jgi:hypothetical protein
MDLGNDEMKAGVLAMHVLRESLDARPCRFSLA